MKCTAKTRLTAEQCLERLAACPALPRGERLALFAEESHGRLFGDRTWHIKLVLGETVAQEVALGIGNRACFCVHPRWFRDWATPVRRLREERRALKAQLVQARLEAKANWLNMGEAAGKIAQHLYCVEHDSFECTMVCKAALEDALW